MDNQLWEFATPRPQPRCATGAAASLLPAIPHKIWGPGWVYCHESVIIEAVLNGSETETSNVSHVFLAWRRRSGLVETAEESSWLRWR